MAGWEYQSTAAFGETPSRRRVSSVSTVIHELPGRVTRPLAFQAAANVTFAAGKRCRARTAFRQRSVSGCNRHRS